MTRSSDQATPLAILCCGGMVPFAVAESLKAQARPFILFAIKGVADAGRVAQYRHFWIGLGQYGRLVRLARQEGCRDIVFIGTLKRPAWWQIGFDFGALRRLPRVIAAFKGGDDRLLRSIGRVFEGDGFNVLGAHEVAPQVLMPDGVLTVRAPSKADLADIARGLEILKVNGPLDIGQAAVIADGHVLAMEGAEGTDAMLEKLAAERRVEQSAAASSGVLVKAPKSTQDRRYDLPAVGPRTVASVKAAGLVGIAIVAGGGVVAELERMISAANRENIFIVGVEAAP
jgi:hypothetical protein